jgi:hypothetical protein
MGKTGPVRGNRVPGGMRQDGAEPHEAGRLTNAHDDPGIGAADERRNAALLRVSRSATVRRGVRGLHQAIRPERR